jgi:alkanesulfonate monooxygenase SsuD/methylene tetrahydromethanopterin reductase-like flavin-dependent oxidoreductase (luciferase family)
VGPTSRSWKAGPFLAALAAVTRRIRLATLCTTVGYRNPAHLAEIAASGDLISRGRLTLGIGAGREEEGRLRALRLSEQQLHGGADDHAELGAALGVRKADRRFLRIEPVAPEPEPLDPAEACQREQADRRKSGRMLACHLGGVHGLPELRDFGAAQASIARRAGEAAYAPRRITFDFPEADRMLKDGME